MHDGMGKRFAHPAVQRGGPSAASSSGELLPDLPVHATHLRLKRQRMRQPGSISLPISRCTRHCALAVAGLHLHLQPRASQILQEKVRCDNLKSESRSWGQNVLWLHGTGDWQSSYEMGILT